MNVNTGQTYETYDAAMAAGEDQRHLVTGPASAIRKLSRLVKAAALGQKTQSAQRTKRRATRTRARRNAMAVSSRRRNRAR